ncbi:hypothetical protein QL285_079868 [Trifolium repens]|nr:hypothetical protein QL285_079868 [Trifolium repens]
MIGRKKRPRKQLPAAMSAANSCTPTDTMPRNYRRPRPSLFPAMPATLQVALPSAQAVAIPCHPATLHVGLPAAGAVATG